ncbi:MAG: hypothetical protein KDA36_07770, partial [Planctomycetaceae bacterium]|nr:hypothetical protein [Planctomycetaceae bacterium]
TLMVLLMTMFAQIFGLAAGIMRDQKGIAENDQRARILTTIIRSDLEHRTFREVMPFLRDTVINDQDLFPKGSLDRKKGYFSYSENDPNNDTDDVLRLTISNTASPKPNVDQTLFYGKAVAFQEIKDLSFPNLQPDGLPDGIPPDSTPNPPLDLTQPNADDGVYENAPAPLSGFVPIDDSTSSAPAAEVVYFLRGNRLYRRLLLIRDPYQGDSEDQPNFDYDADDTDAVPPATRDYFEVPYPFRISTANNPDISFWRDYDFSAYYEGRLSSSGTAPDDRAKFHVLSSLVNKNSMIGSPALGIPAFRFGYSAVTSPPSVVGVTPTDIAPREYLDTDPDPALGTRTFIGAFTLSETAHADFFYPGGYPSPSGSSFPLPSSGNDGLNPYYRYDARMVLNADGAVVAYSDYDIDPISGGETSSTTRYRVEEDLLMSNVHSFDIKIFDPLSTTGADADNGIVGIDEDGDGNAAADTAELGWPGTDDGAWKDLGWIPTSPEIGMFSRDAILLNSLGNTGYCPPIDPSVALANQIPQYRFDTWSPDGGMGNDPPFWSMRYLPSGSFVGSDSKQMIGAWTANTPYNPGDVVFPVTADKKYRLAFKCIVAGTSDMSVEPTWPTVAGNTVSDNVITWLAIDNWRPLRGIQIKIRYVDPPTDQMREVTIVHSLIDQ